MNHTCHWPGCSKQCAPKFWGCSSHWYRLPKFLRDLVWRWYRPGQENDKKPSLCYLAAADLVQRYCRAVNAGHLSMPIGMFDIAFEEACNKHPLYRKLAA